MATVEDLKKARISKGLSQYDIAEYLGIKGYLISFYETGKRKMPKDQLEKALEFVGYQGLIDKEKDIKELTEKLKKKSEEIDDIKYWLKIQKFLYQIYKDNQ